MTPQRFEDEYPEAAKILTERVKTKNRITLHCTGNHIYDIFMPGTVWEKVVGKFTIDRNKPCGCNSGRKFKKCCMDRK